MTAAPDHSYAVARFVERWVADRLDGRTCDLGEYLALFPGMEAEVARCFADLDALGPPSTATEAERVAAVEDSASGVGPFRFVRELGRGGQAIVYLADDLRLGRQAAVKVLEGVGPRFDVSMRRLRREAEIVGKLNHPALCAIFDVGFERGRGYVAMRYVEGETWQQRLARRREQGDKPDRAEVRTVVEFVAAAARALHAAHEAGVVHRDVKPGNLMVTPEGAPVILDFGLAHDTGSDGATLTATGDVFGTPAYMSPEQATGATGLPDRRMDVFALGAALYEGLTLRRAFDGPTRQAVMAAVVNEEPPEIRRENPAIGADLAVVVATAIAKDPADRYATACAFADDLERVLRGEPVRARPVGAVGRGVRWARRRPAIASLLGVILFGLVGTTLWVGAKNDELSGKNDQLSNQIEETMRLSDVRRVRELAAWADRLWPAAPGIVEGPQGIDAWLRAADEVERRRPLHVAALARLPAPTSRPSAEHGTGPTIDEAENVAWRREILTEVLKDLDALTHRIEAITARRGFSLAISGETIEAHRAEWDRTVAEVAADPRYGGLKLKPQVGLVPLGRDPESKLFEFADRRTGHVATRDSSTGRVVMKAETGLVFVLIPGGKFTMGAVPPSDDLDAEDPNVDPNASRFERPLREVALDPFLMSKFEMTVAQWRRTSPPAPGRDGIDAEAMLPITMITWIEISTALGHVACDLPTEAQWEYAARGGTTSCWWTGNSKESLRGAANIKDFRGLQGGLGGDADTWMDDGYAGFAPVGSFKANPFGLHDVVGNAAEFCRDEFLTYEAETRAGDGFRTGQGLQPRVWRGGSCNNTSKGCSSASRDANRANVVSLFEGVRPMRPFDP